MAMFTHELAESQMTRIPILEMKSGTMKAILDYIYTGQVQLTEDTVQSLLSAANLFQMISLRSGCAEFMIKHITVSNCVGVYFFARAHHCDILAGKASEILNSNFR